MKIEFDEIIVPTEKSNTVVEENMQKIQMEYKKKRRRRAVSYGVAVAVLIVVFMGIGYANPVPPGKIPTIGHVVSKNEKAAEEQGISQELQRPDRETVLAVRSAALEGMDSKDIERIRTIVKTANLRLEGAFMNRNLEAVLSDPDSHEWTYFHETGEIITGYAYEQEIWDQRDQLGLTDEELEQQYGQPVYADNDYDAEGMIQLLSELQLTIHNEKFKKNFENMAEFVQKAEETHDVEYVIDIYHLLHDMDYYLLRYGPEDVGKYVQDTSTIDQYYGVLEDYKGTEYYKE